MADEIAGGFDVADAVGWMTADLRFLELESGSAFWVFAGGGIVSPWAFRWLMYRDVGVRLAAYPNLLLLPATGWPVGKYEERRLG